MDEQELLNYLEKAMDKQIFDLRQLLSNLVEEETNNLKIEGLLEKRLNLLEVYEAAEALTLDWMELYLIRRDIPALPKNRTKIEKLSAFKSYLSIGDVSIIMKADQLISLLNKVYETNQSLRLQGRLGTPRLLIKKPEKKKPKTKIAVID